MDVLDAAISWFAGKAKKKKKKIFTEYCRILRRVNA